MPCLLPVMMIALGVEELDSKWGVKVLRLVGFVSRKIRVRRCGPHFGQRWRQMGPLLAGWRLASMTGLHIPVDDTKEIDVEDLVEVLAIRPIALQTNTSIEV